MPKTNGPESTDSPWADATVDATSSWLSSTGTAELVAGALAHGEGAATEPRGLRNGVPPDAVKKLLEEPAVPEDPGTEGDPATDQGAPGWSPPPNPATREDWVGMRRCNKVCICGYAPTVRLIPKADADMDFWGMNDLYANPSVAATDWDMWFDMHDATVMSQNPRTKGDHWNWLRKRRGMPILTLRREKEIPDSIGYPLDLVRRLTWDDEGYFTATPSYMLALAILMGYQEIHVYGINLMGDEEYAYQRPCFEYWCGVAHGRGIKIVVPEGSTILRSSFLYGYETHGYEGDELQRHIKQKLQTHVERSEGLKGALHENQGSIMALKYMLTVTRGFLHGTIAPDKDINQKLQPNMQFGPQGAKEAFLGHVAEQMPPSREELEAKQSEINKHMTALQQLGVQISPTPNVPQGV